MATFTLFAGPQFLPVRDRPVSTHRPPTQCLRWFAEGWRLWRRAPVTLTLFMLAIGVAVFTLQGIPGIGFVTAQIEGGILGAGLVVGLDALAKGRRIGPSALLAGYQPDRFRPVLAISCANLAVTAFQMLATASVYGPGTFGLLFGAAPPEAQRFGFLALLALSGVIPGTLLMFATPLVVLDKVGTMRAIERSVRLVLDTPGPCALFAVISAGLMALGLLGQGLPLLVFVPWMMAAGFAAYRDLRGRL